MNCESIQDQLVDFLYEESFEENESLKSHIENCPNCSKSLESFRLIQSAFQNLKDPQLPPHLTAAVIQEIEKSHVVSESVFSKLKQFIFHPAFVALFIFSLTLGISYFAKDYFKSNPQTAFLTAPAEERNFPLTVRMVDWNENPRVDPDLDQPVLKTAELSGLEQASVESIAAFKHQMAVKYMIDGEDQKASQLLESLIENDLNYSHWDQAVFEHLQLMKKAGRNQEVKKDIARLKEYASAQQEVIARAEMMAR